MVSRTWERQGLDLHGQLDHLIGSSFGLFSWWRAPFQAKIQDCLLSGHGQVKRNTFGLWNPELACMSASSGAWKCCDTSYSFWQNQAILLNPHDVNHVDAYCWPFTPCIRQALEGSRHFGLPQFRPGLNFVERVDIQQLPESPVCTMSSRCRSPCQS